MASPVFDNAIVSELTNNLLSLQKDRALKCTQILLNYSKNLLKDETIRPKQWRFISCDNNKFIEYISRCKQALGVLHLIGYCPCQSSYGSLKFGDSEPNQQLVLSVIADLEKLDSYLRNFRYTDSGLTTQSSQTVPVSNPMTTSLIYSFPETCPAPVSVTAADVQVQDPLLQAVPTSTAAMNQQVQKSSATPGLLCRLCSSRSAIFKCFSCSLEVGEMCQPCSQNFHADPSRTSHRIVRIAAALDESTVPNPDVGLSTSACANASAHAQGLSRPMKDDTCPRTETDKVPAQELCSHCGVNLASMKCNQCKKDVSLMCDKCSIKWHHHPGRVSHSVAPFPCLTISDDTDKPHNGPETADQVQSTPCSMCYINTAVKKCTSCPSDMSMMCDSCSGTYHGTHPMRKKHSVVHLLTGAMPKQQSSPGKIAPNSAHPISDSNTETNTLKQNVAAAPGIPSSVSITSTPPRAERLTPVQKPPPPPLMKKPQLQAQTPVQQTSHLPSAQARPQHQPQIQYPYVNPALNPMYPQAAFNSPTQFFQPQLSPVHPMFFPQPGRTVNFPTMSAGQPSAVSPVYRQAFLSMVQPSVVCAGDGRQQQQKQEQQLPPQLSPDFRSPSPAVNQATPSAPTLHKIYEPAPSVTKSSPRQPSVSLKPKPVLSDETAALINALRQEENNNYMMHLSFLQAAGYQLTMENISSDAVWRNVVDDLANLLNKSRSNLPNCKDALFTSDDVEKVICSSESMDAALTLLRRFQVERYEKLQMLSTILEVERLSRSDLVSLLRSNDWILHSVVNSVKGAAINNIVNEASETVGDPLIDSWPQIHVNEFSSCVKDLQPTSDKYQILCRRMISEGYVQSWARAENTIRLLNLDDVSSNENIRLCDVFQFVRDSNYIDNYKGCLLVDCMVCFDQFSIHQLISLMHCECKICYDCVKNWIQTAVDGYVGIRMLVCPACSQPEQLSHNDQGQTYFESLVMQLQPVLEDVPDLFGRMDEKVNLWHLQTKQNFLWCQNEKCRTGFLGNIHRLKNACPTCNFPMCNKCHKPWKDEHTNRTCEEYANWQEANEFQQHVAPYLDANGIQCPKCHTRFFLARGGCMHFKCTQCSHEFCGGCSNDFVIGGVCTFSENIDCSNSGLHAHHPRNCFYYMRDWDIERLRAFLRDRDVQYDVPEQDEPVEHCFVDIQRETPDGLVDESCGRAISFSGLCSEHYKEHLVTKMNKSTLDPVTEMNIDEVRLIFLRNGQDVPGRGANDSDDQFLTNLREIVQRDIPLPKLCGPVLHR